MATRTNSSTPQLNLYCDQDRLPARMYRPDFRLQMTRWAICHAIATHPLARDSVGAQVAAAMWLAAICDAAGLSAATRSGSDTDIAQITAAAGPIGDDPTLWADQWVATAAQMTDATDRHHADILLWPLDVALGSNLEAAKGVRAVISSKPYQRGAVTIRALAHASTADAAGWLDAPAHRWDHWERGRATPSSTALHQLAANVNVPAERIEALFAGDDPHGFATTATHPNCPCLRSVTAEQTAPEWVFRDDDQFNLDGSAIELHRGGFGAVVLTCSNCDVPRVVDGLGRWPLPPRTTGPDAGARSAATVMVRRYLGHRGDTTPYLRADTAAAGDTTSAA